MSGGGFGREWVERNAECAPGMAWGMEYVAGGPKNIEEALPGFDRADWLFWFCAVNRILPGSMIAEIHELAVVNMPHEHRAVLELLAKIDGAWNPLHCRDEAAAESFAASSLGDLRRCYAWEVGSFYAMMRFSSLDSAKCRLNAQAAILSLVGAIAGKKFGDEASGLAHKQLCDQIRARAKVNR